MRRLVVPVLVLLLGGCSLPLPGGVRGTAGVQAEPQRDGEVLQVLPPGPQAGQSPTQVVVGFLQAQVNADGNHAIARSFLTTSAAQAWDDAVQVQVYDLASQRVTAVPGEKGPGSEAAVTVSSKVTGLIGSDGHFTPQSLVTEEDYRLERVKGEWRLSSVPSGLRLTSADRARSYPPFTVYHVARSAVADQRRLVPERVFVPAGAGLARRLVDRSLHRPSGALADTVVDRGELAVRSVGTDSAGVVTVDLDASATALSPALRQGVSAQLVWTLRALGTGFSGLRLLAGGQPLRVPGEDAVQDDQSWASYDPSGLSASPPYLYVDRRRLKASAGVVLPTTGRVDAAALDPSGELLGLLEGRPTGPVTVRVGPLSGPPSGTSYPEVVTAPGLESPTFGSGWRGLWMLQEQRYVVLLLTGRPALMRVPVRGGLPAGAVTALAVSRDGARLALVVDERLYVGVVVGAGTSTRVLELTALLPGAEVSDVDWVTGTELAVVGHVGGGAAQLLRLAVDGSGLENLNTAGRVPEHVSASPAGILFTSGGAVYAYTGRTPTRIASGSAPAYPG